MTDIKKFMSVVFDKLIENFPSATIAYEHKEMSDTHFFKITPKSVYNSEEFIDFSMDIDEEFYQTDSDGIIGFITENSLTELKPTKTHIPAVNLSSFEKVNLFEENIGDLNVFVKNEESNIELVDHSFSLEMAQYFGLPSFAMAA